jgi:signal transduction histidine kinase
MVRQIEARSAENRTLSEDLHRQSAQRSQLLKRLITAQEDERTRVARELHDELGQFLSGLALRAEAMERLITSDPVRALELLAQIRALTTEATDQMYDLVLDLRPSALDDLGLTAALRAHIDRLLIGTGITFKLTSDGLPERLPPEIETTFYRVCQEALSNVVRHSGAKHVRVSLAQHGDVFEGEIIDDGHGFDREAVNRDGQSPRGLGLLGMQERITQCGGQLTIVSRPGSGTHLHICVPLEADCD